MKTNHLFFGIFVGSFNPPTIAHFQIASDLIANNQLKQIYFLPVNSKKNNLVSIEHRLAMLNLKLLPSFKTLNIYDYSPSGLFNIDVLKKIPHITHIIMGSDLFLKFKTFKDYEEILKNYYLIIITRQNFDITKEIKENYLIYQDKIIIIKKNYQASSTLARNNLNTSDSLKYLDSEILSYIKTNHLYS